MIQFNSKVDILRVTRARDDYGGFKETESIVYQDLPCRINWTRGSERIQFDKTTYYRDAKLYTRYMEVLTGDRVKYQNVTYEIVDIEDVDNLHRLLVLDLRLIS